jgi:hypothetical protein
MYVSYKIVSSIPHSRYRLFKCPLSPVSLYNAHNRRILSCISFRISTQTKQRTPYIAMYMQTNQTKQNKQTNKQTNKQLPSKWEPVLLRICKRRQFKSFAPPFQNIMTRNFPKESSIVSICITIREICTRSLYGPFYVKVCLYNTLQDMLKFPTARKNEPMCMFTNDWFTIRCFCCTPF